MNAYVREEERSKINYLSFYCRKLRKQEEIKSKVTRIKEIIKIRAEVNEIENIKTLEKNQ